MAHRDRISEARIAAQRLAEAAVLGTEHGQQREVMQRVARDLRDATRQCASEDEKSSILHALATEVAALPPGLSRDLADLRVFARLSLLECVDVLEVDPREAIERWHNTKVRLFAAVRRGRPRTE